MNTALTLCPPVSGTSIAISAPVHARKVSLLSASRQIAEINDAFAQDLAVDSVREIKKLLAHVESSRVDVKGPVLDLGRAIDNAAKQFRTELDTEVDRLTKGITAFQVAERRRAEEAERQRLEELRRIEQARIEAERAEAQRRAEAERASAAQRKAEEDAFAATGAGQAEAVAERQACEAAEGAQRAAEAVEVERKRQLDLAAQESAVRAAVAKSPAPSAGMSVREVWTFEVTDVWALAARNKDMVSIEPKTAAINRAIADGLRSCPGLRIYKEVKTGVRI